MFMRYFRTFALVSDSITPIRTAESVLCKTPLQAHES